MHMFNEPRPSKKGVQRVHRGEHLRLFYDALVWKPNRLDFLNNFRNFKGSTSMMQQPL